MEAVKTFNSEVRTAARPPARPQPARGSRAELGHGPQFPPRGGATAAGRPWGGEGNGPRPSPGQAGPGEGRGRAGGGPEAGPIPEAAVPRSRVGCPEAWSAHPQPVALQGLNCCRTSLCRSSRVIEEADTRMRGLGEDPRGGDPKSRYT